MKTFILSLILGTSLFTQNAADIDNKDSHGNKASWELPGDVLGTSNQISFNQGANEVWYFMEGVSLVHNPLTYQFLPKYSAICPATLGVVGLACWWDTLEPSNQFAAFPHIQTNFSDHDLFDPLSGTNPALSVKMHPQNTRLAIIAWVSPQDLKIDIKGNMKSMYPSIPCGDGVRWSVEKGTSVLASGDTSLSSSGFSVKKLEVDKGQAIYFIADPKGNDLCDSTLISVTITK
jgi:hypothetical protein